MECGKGNNYSSAETAHWTFPSRSDFMGKERGFGGKCIPKDVRALNQELKEEELLTIYLIRSNDN